MSDGRAASGLFKRCRYSSLIPRQRVLDLRQFVHDLDGRFLEPLMGIGGVMDLGVESGRDERSKMNCTKGQKFRSALSASSTILRSQREAYSVKWDDVKGSRRTRRAERVVNRQRFPPRG